MKTILSLLLGLCIATNMLAQVNAIQRINVFTKTSFIQNKTINGNDTTITNKMGKEPQVFVTLIDTSNITSFVVKLGTAQGGNDIIQKTFSFGDTGTFTDGTSYTRKGYAVTFILGRYPALTSTYYAQVSAVVNGSPQTPLNYTAH